MQGLYIVVFAPEAYKGVIMYPRCLIHTLVFAINLVIRIYVLGFYIMVHNCSYFFFLFLLLSTPMTIISLNYSVLYAWPAVLQHKHGRVHHQHPLNPLNHPNSDGYQVEQILVLCEWIQLQKKCCILPRKVRL